MANGRMFQFRRNASLEKTLHLLNELLAGAEDGALAKFDAPRHPVLLVVGCARSGSTLLMQWLAESGHFAYPTNLLSRFYRAPLIGALVQQVLTDPALNFRNELFDLAASSSAFSSVLGKTQGALAPNEFWYFWRRFFPFGEIQRLEPEVLAQVDDRGFLAELAAIESVQDKPFAAKGMILNWNLTYLDALLPKALFLHVVRDPLMTAQSLLEARQKFFGRMDAWYSFKPPEYTQLQSLDPYAQVAGQVYFTNQAIQDQLAGMAPCRWLTIDYAEFCRRPRQVADELTEKLSVQGWQPTQAWNHSAATFEARYERRITQEEEALILCAYERFANGAVEVYAPGG